MTSQQKLYSGFSTPLIKLCALRMPLQTRRALSQKSAPLLRQRAITYADKSLRMN